MNKLLSGGVVDWTALGEIVENIHNPRQWRVNPLVVIAIVATNAVK